MRDSFMLFERIEEDLRAALKHENTLESAKKDLYPLYEKYGRFLLKEALNDIVKRDW